MAVVLPVYMYHQIAPPEAPGYEPYLYVTPATFRRQVRELKAGGLTLVTLSQAWAQIAAGQAHPRLAVLTFDDVCLYFAHFALPILLEEQVPATVFQIADIIGGQLDVAARNLNTALPPLNARQLAALAQAGIEVGSHTLSHRELPRLDNEPLVAELVDSRRRIEDATGRPCPALCYPRGRFSPRVCQAADAAGYAVACTTLRGNVHDPADRLILSRIRAAENRVGFRLNYTTSAFYDWWNRKRRERQRLRFAAEDAFAASPAAAPGLVRHAGFPVKP